MEIRSIFIVLLSLHTVLCHPQTDSISHIFTKRFSILDSLIFNKLIIKELPPPHTDNSYNYLRLPSITGKEQDISTYLISSDGSYGLTDSLSESARLFFSADTSLSHIVPSSTYFTDLNESFKETSLKEDSLYALSLQEKLSLMHAANGLHISGQTYYRPDNAFGFDEDDAYSVYRAKFQVEIGWNYFESSLFNRKGKTSELKVEEELDRVLSKGRQFHEVYSLLRKNIRCVHDSIISGLLSCRLENIRLLQQNRQQLLKERKIGGSLLLEIMNQRSGIEQKLNSLGSGCKTVGHLLPVPPSILLVDTTALFRDIDKISIDIKAHRLKEQLIDYKIENASYWENVTIRPFVRYSHYIRSRLRNSSNVDLGVSFRFPLSAENKRKKRMMAAEKNIQTSQTEAIYRSTLTATMLIINNIDRCNRVCLTEYSLVKDLYACLLERKEGYISYKGEYSFPDRLQEYNIYIEALERLQEILRDRDMLLVSLQELYPENPILDYCKYISF